MTAGEIAQFITAIATLVASVGAVIIGWRNSAKIDVVHALTDGMTSKLVSLTATASKAEGVKQGRDEKGAEIQAQDAGRTNA